MARMIQDYDFKGKHVNKNVIKVIDQGHLSGSVVEHLPPAQGEILESWDGVPHLAPCTEPASPFACVSAPLSVSLVE